jgi:hypothetical protein
MAGKSNALERKLYEEIAEACELPNRWPQVIRLSSTWHLSVLTISRSWFIFAARFANGENWDIEDLVKIVNVNKNVDREQLNAREKRMRYAKCCLRWCAI